jgi:microcystin-dependent protein
MSTPFLGEVRITSFNFAPKGWALCNGQLMQISQNQALFALLGTTYGGNGVQTFALPNLQSRTPVHFGEGISQGQVGGEEAHTLTLAELPTHDHADASFDLGTSTDPSAKRLGAKSGRGGKDIYANTNINQPLDPGSVDSVGGGQAHENRQPFLVVNFIIALTGIFPPHN